MAAPTPEEIAKHFTAFYQPIVDLNTGAVAGFEALARVVEADGSITTAGTVIEVIERRSDTLKALIRTILASIRRDMAPSDSTTSPFLRKRQYPAGHIRPRPSFADPRGAKTNTIP